MTTRFEVLAAAVLLSLAFFVHGVSVQAEPTPTEAPINYLDKAPQPGTPQAAMVNLVLLRESGRTDEAAKLISKECPDWLREGMLKSDKAEYGPMKMHTLAYHLREYTAEKALVNVNYNTENGSFKDWTRKVIREDGKWVVR